MSCHVTSHMSDGIFLIFGGGEGEGSEWDFNEPFPRHRHRHHAASARDVEVGLT